MYIYPIHSALQDVSNEEVGGTIIDHKSDFEDVDDTILKKNRLDLLTNQKETSRLRQKHSQDSKSFLTCLTAPE